jgi:hypothetical protein
MTKKTALILAAVGTGCILAVSLLLWNGIRGGRYAKSQEERTDCADERIRELLDDAAYRDGDAETRKALAAEVLHALEKEHCIKALYYDPKNQMYSYQYADGSLGGLTMTDFQDSVPLAMN